MAAEAGLVGFGRALRAAGVSVGSGQVTTFCRAAARLDVADPLDVYWAGRACLVSRHSDLSTYDAVFARYFGGAPRGVTAVADGWAQRPGLLLTGPEVRQPSAPAGADGSDGGVRASAAEVLRHRDFADCTPEELDALRVLLARLRLTPPLRPSRRTRPAPRGRDHDLRRTVRRALRSQGELLQPAWRARRRRPRRVVLLLDVSGSMAGYARALLQFSHSAVAAPGGRTEVFCFGTRLTRITPQLRQRSVDRALADAGEAVVDWEGGTRIGESLGAFLRIWGRRGLARGAVVLICSDGLERGEPAVLAAAMERLARFAHRIVWVNPLRGDPRYQPLARGMAVALPFVDEFVSGHDLASLEALAALLPELR